MAKSSDETCHMWQQRGGWSQWGQKMDIHTTLLIPNISISYFLGHFLTPDAEHVHQPSRFDHRWCSHFRNTTMIGSITRMCNSCGSETLLWKTHIILISDLWITQASVTVRASKTSLPLSMLAVSTWETEFTSRAFFFWLYRVVTWLCYTFQ